MAKRFARHHWRAQWVSEKLTSARDYTGEHFGVSDREAISLRELENPGSVTNALLNSKTARVLSTRALKP